jgi:cell wall-associated NlpC family hydrolase
MPIAPIGPISVASITAQKRYALRVDPYEVSWNYNLRTHIDDTYGGKVVQILGTDLGELTISSITGLGGRAELLNLADFFRGMCEWQVVQRKPATFSFPYKKYSLTVWAHEMTYNDSIDNISFPYTMTFYIEDDIGGNLNKIAMTDALRNLTDGIGYVRNDYNYPTPGDEMSGIKVNNSANPQALPTPVTGVDSSLAADQQANAQAIISVAGSLGLSSADVASAAIIAIMTALTESEMKIINYGDSPGGSMSSSRGMYQQQDPWGPLADRLDPVKSTTMFFQGGQGGQKGLLDISGWQTMEPWQAAQAVQGSEFSDGSNYQAKYSQAQSIYGKISASASNPPVVSTNGGNITIPTGMSGNPPNPEIVEPRAAGQVIKTSTNKIAAGLSAGLSQLGLPYVFGGGDGSGPNDGSARAGTAENAGQGIIGFDCSGLTKFVLAQAGYNIPDDSTTQRAGGVQIPFSQKLAGDIIGYPGHVAIYVGTWGGVDFILEAYDVGSSVIINNNSRTDYDNVVYRYWS